MSAPARLRPGAAPGIACLLALALAAPAGAGAPDALDLLQPGTRPDVALGGDPFASPLDDGAGFWSAPPSDARRCSRIEAGLSLPAGFGSGGGTGRLEAGGLRWTASERLPLGRRVAWLAARVERPSWQGEWAGPPGPLQVGGTAWRLALAGRVAGLLPGVTVQGVVPAPLGAAESSREGGAGIRWAGRGLALQGAWVRARTPERVSSGLYDEPIAAALNLRTDRYAADGRLGPWRALALEYSGSWAIHGPAAARERGPVYWIEPAGDSRAHQLSAAWGRPGGPRALLRRTLADLDAWGTVAWSGVSFAHLDYLAADLDSWLAAVELPVRGGGRWLLDAEAAHLEARARGIAQGWPFTSGFEELLGVQLDGLARGRARWTRWHAALEQRLGAAGRWRAGLAWYDVAPQASLETWRPLFMGVGRTDEESHVLDARRVQLGAIAAGVRLGGRAWSLEVEARQFVFARCFRTGRAAGSVFPAGGAAGDDEAGPERPWPGGTHLAIALTRRS